MEVLKTKDGFLWANVTEKAKDIFNIGIFEIYVVNNDDSDYLIESYKELNEALGNGKNICIELCHNQLIKNN